jgi:hypothetical protein
METTRPINPAIEYGICREIIGIGAFVVALTVSFMIVSFKYVDEFKFALKNLLYFTNGFDKKTAIKAPTPYPA